jgi:hypothetical protein
MKRSIFDKSHRSEVIARVNMLTEASEGRWGVLTSSQMVHHLYLACKMAFDEVEIPDQSNLLTRTLGKWMFLSNIKPPGREKGKIQTFSPIDIVRQNISVESLANELAQYQAILERVVHTQNLSIKHPLFGKMNRDDWGLLCYAHADYHLTQFSL